jgi:precorrin-6Y C5,15-methyltransferase (decarboxylating)
MTSVHVVGIGLDGASGLADSVRQIVEQATLLVGSDRHLRYFPDHPAEKIVLGNLQQAIAEVQRRLAHRSDLQVVILASGDPLFFGLGRLLLAELPPEQLTFHPHLSAVQLAFNRIKVPWQDAQIISAHGRSLDELTQALQQGADKIAVLTDAIHTPAAIARLIVALDLPSYYQFWVCENLGSPEERIQSGSLSQAEDLLLLEEPIAPLNVVVLLRLAGTGKQPLDLKTLPLLGLPDQTFLSFSDRPGLMTKREVRLLVLGELALQPQQTIWDVGAGTGSVSIEIARLFPSTQVYAIEKTAMGTALIEQNMQRFQVENVISIHGSAPEMLYRLPHPDRIFIGGSGGDLSTILGLCGMRLIAGGIIVLALATLEHLHTALAWVEERSQRELGWSYHLLQVQLSRSVPVGPLTRFAPLNPVTLLTIKRSALATSH